MKKVFVFGNPIVKEDALPLQLLPALKKTFPEIEFIEFDPTGNLSELGRNPIIIDTVQAITDVVVINDVNKIKTDRMYTLHDLDLGINLVLMKKMGMLDSILILGVPMQGDKEKIKKELIEKLKTILGK